MRAVVVSHLYADPANRAKLQALAGLGVDVAAAVPDRWVAREGVPRPPRPAMTAGCRWCPIPVRGSRHRPRPGFVEREGASAA